MVRTTEQSEVSGGERDRRKGLVSILSEHRLHVAREAGCTMFGVRAFQVAGIAHAKAQWWVGTWCA